MRKIVIILCVLFSACLHSAHAQDDFFNDSLRKKLKRHLVDKDVAWNPDAYNTGNLDIVNEIC